MTIEYSYDEKIRAEIRVDGESATLSFPCGETHIRDTLREMGADNPDDFHVRISAIEKPKALKILENRVVDLDELNFLAKYMDSLDRREMNRFVAAVTETKPDDLKTIINMVFNLERFALIPYGVDYNEAGRIYELSTRGCMSREEFETRDFSPVGKALFESGKGIETELGTLFINEQQEFFEYYDGTVFPQYCAHDCLVSAVISFNNRNEFVDLPEDELAIDRAVARLGAKSLDECRIKLCDIFGIGELPIENFETILAENGLYALNEFAESLRYSVPETQIGMN